MAKKIAFFGLGSVNWIGGVQYITNLIRALDATGRKYEVHLIKGDHQEFAELRNLTSVTLVLHSIDTVFPPWTLINRIGWYLQRKFMGRVAPRVENFFIRNKFDFVFPMSLSDAGGRLRSAAWIADFQYHYYPEGASREFTRAAYGEISFIANRAHQVILSSKTCESDCHQLFPQTIGRTVALPFTVYINPEVFGNSKFEAIREKYQVPRDFLIVSNSFCPTKNHRTLFGALALLKQEGITVPLLCTGNIVDQRNLHFANSILVSLTEFGIRGQVYLLGIVPREDQLMLYRMSKAIVQPSLNEGWSTSVEEAKALGKKLVVSDIPVHQEQVSDKTYMFPALDVIKLAEKIRQLWTDTKGKEYPDLAEEKTAWDQYQVQVQDFALRLDRVIGQ